MQCLGSKSKDLIGFSFIMLKLKKSLLYFEKTKNSQEKERKKKDVKGTRIYLVPEARRVVIRNAS